MGTEISRRGFPDDLDEVENLALASQAGGPSAIQQAGNKLNACSITEDFFRGIYTARS